MLVFAHVSVLVALLIVSLGPGSQTKGQIRPPDTHGRSEDEDELQSLGPKTSVTYTKQEFKDPTKISILPPKEDVQPRPFRNPMLVHPLLPRDVGGQGEIFL